MLERIFKSLKTSRPILNFGNSLLWPNNFFGWPILHKDHLATKLMLLHALAIKQQFFVEYDWNTYVFNVKKIHNEWKVKDDADN